MTKVYPEIKKVSKRTKRKAKVISKVYQLSLLNLL